MAIYLLILFFIFICGILNPYIKKNIQLITKIYSAEFLILFLLGGIRKDVGVDYVNYEEIYRMSDKLYAMKELGFIWIIQFLNNLKLDFSVFCIIFMAVTLLGVFRFVCINSPYILFSILIYYSLGNYYFSAFNAMRQAFATAIFLNLLQYIQERKFIIYTLSLIAVSFFIHASAVVLIPLYFFLYRKWGWTIKLIFFSCIAIFSSFLFGLIMNTPYAFYIKNENFASSVPLTYYLIAIFAICIIIYSYVKPDFERRNTILINLNFIVIILLYLIFTYEGTVMVKMISRFLGYFTIIYVVLIPIFIAEWKLFTNRCVSIITISSILAFLSFWALYKNGILNKMVPYKTIFN